MGAGLGILLEEEHMSVGAYALITLEDYKSYAGIENSQIERDAISLYSDDGTAATVAKSGNILTLAKTGGTGSGHSIDLAGGTPVIVTDITNGVCTTAETQALKVGDLVIFAGDASVDGNTYEITALNNDSDFTIDDLTVNPGAVTATTCILDCTTLSKLMTLIDHHTGWTANLVGWSSADSADLKNLAATDCLLADEEQTLKFYDNFILEKLIDRASAIIETCLNRNLKTRPYIFERYDGGGQSLFLRNTPITAVVQISCGMIDVIRIKCQSTTSFNAYVSVDRAAQTLKLMRDGVIDKRFDLSLAANDTLGELAAVINAEAGWEAAIALSTYAGWPSSLLFDQLNKYCADADTWVQVPGEPLSGYEVEGDTGIVELSGSCPTGFQNIFASYSGGFVTIPHDIVIDCCRFVAYLDNLRDRDESLEAETKLDYKWSAVDLEKALGPEKMNNLKRHRRMNI